MKIIDKFSLIKLKGDINYAKATIKQFEEFKQNDDVKEILQNNKNDLKKAQKELSKYRNDIYFLIANKSVNYRRNQKINKV